MSHLIYYNIFICFVVFGTAITTGRFIIKRADNRFDRSFGLFWFFFGILWFFAGMSLLSWKLGYPNLSRIFFYIDQVFVPLHIIFIADYVIGFIFKNKKINNILLTVNAIPSILFITLLFAFGIETVTISDWSVKFQPPFISFVIIVILMIEGGLLLLTDIIINLYQSFFKKKKNYIARILVDFSFILYVAGGIMDESGHINGWPLLFIRTIMVIAVIVGYIGYTAIEDYNAKNVG